MVYICNESDLVSETIYLDWLRHTSAQRQNQCLRYRFYKDRLLCLLSYRLLCYALDVKSIEFEYDQYGKPLLKDINRHFNLTHCDGLVACIITDTPSGIDAERLTTYPSEITGRVFTHHENTQIQASDTPDKTFFTLWTLKESYIKALGLGLRFPLLDVQFTLSGDSIQCSDKSYWFQTLTLKDHVVSYCVKKSNTDHQDNIRKAHNVQMVSIQKLL